MFLLPGRDRARLLGAASALAVLIAATPGAAARSDIAAPAGSQPWSFGVMGDTQWTTTDPSNQNPNGVSVSIIKQLDQLFIEAGVRFVVQVGDLTNNGQNADIDARAAAAQELYDAHIGFFPMRGNHETYGTGNGFGIAEFQKDFPQTQGGANAFGATNFSSPTSVSADLAGMSYSFDYGSPGDSARFVILDNWVTPTKNVAPGNGYNYGYSFGDQQAWISARLNAATRGTEQAFVFSHQPLMAEDHQDSPFVGNTAVNPAMQDAFYASLQDNGVRYYISGHDHMDQRSIIASPNGKSSVEELISASASSKFYTPSDPANAGWAGQKVRETSLQQELYTVGYYIYTVDGPRVTVDYYADDQGGWLSDGSYPTGPSGAGSRVTPTFHFVKKGSWGYSTNGRQLLVGGTHDTAFATVQDTFGDTSANILSGRYANTLTDRQGRTLTEAVDTGWTPAGSRAPDKALASDALTLWGMAPLGATQNPLSHGVTSPYTLSLSYRQGDTRQIGTGSFGLAVRDQTGQWVNAVSENVGGTSQFVVGPWRPGYGLGTYGIDPATKTVWAVLDYCGDFAAASGV